MATNIGINLIETDGRAARTITAAPVSVAAFLVRSQRGVPNLPVTIRGFSDFTVNFGGFSDNMFGAFAVRGFFDNGGFEARVVRLVGAGASAASRDFNDRAANPTLRVSAGVRGRSDPGSWGNGLRITMQDHPRGILEVPAQVTGGTAGPFALANGQTLDVTVNGGASPVTVTFVTADFGNIASATAAEVASSIRRQTTAFRAAALVNGRLLLASSIPGPASRLAIAGTAAAALGFAGATLNTDGGIAAGTQSVIVHSTGGVVAGSAVRLESRGLAVGTAAIGAAMPANGGITVTPDGGAAVPVDFQAADFANGFAAITPAEVVAAINRRANGFFAALRYDGLLVIASNTFGPGSSIGIGAGAVDATAALGLAGSVPEAGVRVNRAVTAIAEPYRLISWTGGLAAALVPLAARIQSAEFDLAVSVNGIEVERFESLSMQNGLPFSAPAVINDETSGSRYITAVDLNSASGAAEDVPAAIASATLTTAGADGSAPVDADYLGDPGARTGFHALDQESVQLLACPETTSPGAVTAALAYCENRGDLMFVGTAPRLTPLQGVINYASAFRARKVFGALYAPWIQVLNPLDQDGTNPLRWIPPTGHVMGTYARISEARGVWKAPAGDEARLANALAVEFDMTDTDHTNLVRNGGVNGIRAVPGAGIIIDASRTLSSDTRWLFVGTRRLFNFIKVSVREGLRFVTQEPNSEALRRTVRFNTVTPFLLGLWRQGAFGNDPPDRVFTVVCDASNNPPAEVAIGNFRIEIYFYPVKPAESIVITVGQQESAASADEA